MDEHNAYIARRSSLAGFVVEGILGAIAFASAYVVALPWSIARHACGA
ncbi:hypothetical protein [Burkholderia pseudomallei]|nr:hypothetical protein [Burkholderia pseudomallei]